MLARRIRLATFPSIATGGESVNPFIVVCMFTCSTYLYPYVSLHNRFEMNVPRYSRSVAMRYPKECVNIENFTRMYFSYLIQVRCSFREIPVRHNKVYGLPFEDNSVVPIIYTHCLSLRIDCIREFRCVSYLQF